MDTKVSKIDTMEIRSYKPFRKPAFPVLFSLFAFLSLLASPSQADAQQRFKAGLIAGVTAAQIDGDQSAGYHKLGLQGGLRGVTILSPKQEASIEILYSQRGSRNQPKTFPEFSTTLGFIEVPVQWHYNDWLVEGEDNEPDWYRVQFNVGLSYSRLLNTSDKYNDGYGIYSAIPYLKKNSYCFLVGASLYATRHVGFSFRYHRAINKLYKINSGGNFRSDLIEHYLAFQAVYMF